MSLVQNPKGNFSFNSGKNKKKSTLNFKHKKSHDEVNNTIFSSHSFRLL